MKKYDLSCLMKKAWSLYRQAMKKGTTTFSEALKNAWKWLKVQSANRAKVEAAAVAAGYGDQVVHTWAGWKSEGREVCHTEKCAFQVVLADPTTAKGTRVASYFTRAQTFEPLAG